MRRAHIGGAWCYRRECDGYHAVALSYPEGTDAIEIMHGDHYVATCYSDGGYDVEATARLFAELFCKANCGGVEAKK